MSAHQAGAAPDIRSFTADDGVSLEYRDWTPARTRGVIVCLHGIRSHSAWYLDSCTRLYRGGYRVVFPDRRGSGINRRRGEDNTSCGTWIGDTEAIVRHVIRRAANIPVHLLGISWGGRLAVAVAARGAVRINSLLLSTPGLASLRDYPFRDKVNILLSRLFDPARRFTLPLENPSLFTDDPDEMNYIEEDELGLRRVSARFLMESRKLERLARKSCSSVAIPSLLLLAGRDEIIDNEAVKKLFARFSSTDKIIKTYPRARHTLEFDACREEYFRDLAGWVDKHN